MRRSATCLKGIRGATRAVRSLACLTRANLRPNPLGLHPVTVHEIDGTRVKIGPIEAFNGTPVVDIKSAAIHADG